MIRLTRLNGTEIWLNAWLIESLEQTPDTVVTLTNGHKYVVKQATEHIVSELVNLYSRVGLAGALNRRDVQE